MVEISLPVWLSIIIGLFAILGFAMFILFIVALIINAKAHKKEKKDRGQSGSYYD